MVTKTTSNTGKGNTGKVPSMPKAKPATQPATTATTTLTRKQQAVLALLLANPGTTKKVVWLKCKAGASVLGAATKANPTGLLGAGYITATRGAGGVSYTLTPAGQAALAASQQPASSAK